ncbi:hypothetical protein KKD52_16245 [Myxococcota bacterium]|nr:hypothetical protein [Myxococcota bacterium]MBU1412741.1 hypothetical protein [Myxococcota bacterium]MBU1511906.1 hypothetical protein [Myxococcota bacterium]
MKTRIQLMIGAASLSMALTGCYMNPPPSDGRGAPAEQPPAGEYEQPGEQPAEETEVPPPAPGAEGGEYEGGGEQPAPVDPGPSW